MKYEAKFIQKEKTFYPRKNFKHDEVIKELSSIVRDADHDIYNKDQEIDKLYDELDVLNSRLILMRHGKTFTKKPLLLGLVLGVILGYLIF